MKKFFNCQILLLHLSLFCVVLAAPQQPEINDQYENVTSVDEIKLPKPNNVTIEKNEVVTPKINDTRRDEHKITVKEETVTTKICSIVTRPLIRLISTPKVNSVLKNIGTCIVNGAMELITYYFPPPLIPLIATAAGMIIPFEPVVLLREKMPVTSYRRAFRTAMSSFLSTFDRFKLDDDSDDPYMTRRFNRRFMNDSGEKNKVDNEEDRLKN